MASFVIPEISDLNIPLSDFLNKCFILGVLNNRYALSGFLSVSVGVGVASFLHCNVNL